MRWLLSIVGIVFALLGVVWILQGTNIISSGFMAGHMQYAVLGLIVGLGGIGLVVFANRRERGMQKPSERLKG